MNEFLTIVMELEDTWLGMEYGKLEVGWENCSAVNICYLSWKRNFTQKSPEVSGYMSNTRIDGLYNSFIPSF